MRIDKLSRKGTLLMIVLIILIFPSALAQSPSEIFSQPLFYSDIGSLYDNFPLIIDLLIFLVFFMGLTKVIFDGTYAVQGRLGIALAMTFALLFFEIQSEDFTLKSGLGVLIIGVILIAAASLYFLVYVPDIGIAGTLAVCFVAAYVFTAITLADKIGPALAAALNILFIILFLFAVFRLAVFLWRVFNITEEDEKL